MYYDGLLLLRTTNIPTNKIYVVDDKDNFISNNINEIQANANSMCSDYANLSIEFVNPQSTVSNDDLKLIISKQYQVDENQLDKLVEQSRQNYTFDFWQILKDDLIEFEEDNSNIFNAFIVLSVSVYQYKFYRIALHSLSDAKDLSRLVFNEYDYAVRPKSFGFLGFSGFEGEGKTTNNSSPNVGVPLDENDKQNLKIVNERIAQIVDTIQSMDREQGISWLSQIIGNNMVANLSLAEPKPSKLKIDDELNLLLVDRNNAIIKLDPLTKSLYYTYLIHPDGIDLYNFNYYENQMLEIYKMTSNRGNVDKLRESVKHLTEPYSELLPQKISRMRRLFLEYFPKSVVDKYYIPKYEEGAPRTNIHRIFLPGDMIEITKELDYVRNMKINFPEPYDSEFDSDEDFEDEIQEDFEDEIQEDFEDEIQDDLEDEIQDDLEDDSNENILEDSSDELDYAKFMEKLRANVNTSDEQNSKWDEVHFDDKNDNSVHILM